MGYQGAGFLFNNALGDTIKYGLQTWEDGGPGILAGGPTAEAAPGEENQNQGVDGLRLRDLINE